MRLEFESPAAGGTANGADMTLKRPQIDNRTQRKFLQAVRGMNRQMFGFGVGTFNRFDAFIEYIEEAEQIVDYDLLSGLFWRGICDVWPSCDGIDHIRAWQMLGNFAGDWDRRWLSRDCRQMLRNLPSGRFPIYRGQSAHYLWGCSWTLSPSIAAWFAKTGLRGSGTPEPVVLVTEVEVVDIAVAINVRNEQEVVPFYHPEDEDVRIMPLDSFCAEFGVTGDKDRVAV